MHPAVEMEDRTGTSEDVSISALSMSESGRSLSVSMYGPGSLTALGLLRLGRCMIRGLSVAASRKKLASITRRIRSHNASAARDSRVCDELVELSRPIIHSETITRRAWHLIMCFIKQGELSGLVTSLSKRREVEIQIFLNEALLKMPVDWIVDPLIERRNRESRTENQTVSEEDKLALPRGFLKLLSELMHSSCLALAHRKTEANRGSLPLSLASFVSASGKMVLGPPAFTNKIRVQIGQNALRNIIKSMLCGRLNTMSTRLRFETGGSTPNKEIVGMLAELLSIYRSFPDDRCIQRQCRELLFISISRFHTVALVRTLASWSRTELHGLICELASWLKPFVYSGMLIDNFFPKAYRAYLTCHSSNDHPVIPFLYFCIHMARSSETAASLLLDLDLVGMLRDMCFHDFPNPADNVINTSSRTERVAKSNIFASLTLLFAALSSHPSCATRLLHTPTLAPWIVSIYYTPDFIGLPTSMVLQDAWLLLETRVVKLVLVSLEYTLKSDGSRRDSRSVRRGKVELLPLEEVYRDLITVIRDESSDQEMVYSAADTFLTCVEFGAHSRRVLNKILSEARVRDTYAILEGIHRSLAPESAPYNHMRNPHSWVSTHSYLTALAHSYVQELRMFSPLVDELLGSRTCSGRWPFGSPLSNQVQVRTSIISSNSTPPSNKDTAVPVAR